METQPHPEVLVRMAAGQDAVILARHRAEMFREMGQLSDRAYAPLVETSAGYFERAIPAGEYVGWLASPQDDPHTPVAGAGMQIRAALPRPDPLGTGILLGPQGLIVNVFTERDWRRRGLAALLMQHVLDWSRSRGIRSLVLHASADGRPLYEKLGFVATNEMSYTGPP